MEQEERDSDRIVSGKLKTGTLQALLKTAKRTRQTGRLLIKARDGFGTITLFDGEIISATTPLLQKRVSEQILERGIITEDELRIVVEKQKKNPHYRLEKLLIDEGCLSKDTLFEILKGLSEEALFGMLFWEGIYRFKKSAGPDGPATSIVDIDEFIRKVDDSIDDLDDELGTVVGDPSRNLSNLIDNLATFDCPSDGLAADGDTTPDYLTDGYVVTCLTDEATGLKSDGVAFIHDTPVDVLWKHTALSGVALSEAVPNLPPGPPAPPEPPTPPEPPVPPEPPAPPEPPTPAVLFSDDFGADSAASWLTEYAKYFEFGDGTLLLGNDKKKESQNRVFTGDETWTDYVIDTVATLESGDGYNIYFRSSDPGNTDGYVFQYNEQFGSGAFLLRRIDNGKQREPFAKVYVRDTALGKEFDWYDTQHKIRVEVAGSEYRAYVDGELVVVGVDDSYSSGMVGLGTWSMGIAAFENFFVSTF